MTTTRRSCAHFTFAGTTCKADVPVESTRDADLRLACHEINGITSTIACPKLAWPTTAAAPMGRMMQKLLSIVEGVCPTCKQPIDGERQVGKVIQATPCGHVIRGRSTDAEA